MESALAEVTFKPSPGKVKEGALWTSRGRAFYEEARASAKALRQGSLAASWKSGKIGAVGAEWARGRIVRRRRCGRRWGKIRKRLACHRGDFAEFGGATAFERKGTIHSDFCVLRANGLEGARCTGEEAARRSQGVGMAVEVVRCG